MIPFVSVLIVLFHLSLSACPPQPPLKAVADGTASGDVGQTLGFDGSEKFCCPDNGTITEYRWVLPPQAYCIQGDTTSQLACKFSPSGTYDVELQVKCSHGIWNTEYLSYPDGNRFVFSVTVQQVSGPWYVKPDGSDANNGKTWQTGFRMIQTAIDSASEGDEIIVKSGTAENPVIYDEQLDLRGKSLDIHSESPDDWIKVQNTIIDAGQRGTAVLYRGNESGQLKGFTITGGAPAGDGLAVRLTLDDGTGLVAADSSGKGRNGSLVFTGDPVWTTGRMGGALEFDGNDYIEIEGYKGVTGRASRTCTAWIKTTVSGKDIINWGDQATGGKWIIRVNETGALRAEVANGYIYGTTLINDGLWHHIAVVLADDGSPDISEARLYVDGQIDTTIGGVLACPVNTSVGQDVSIGVYTTYPARYFQGRIDDVRIYSRALSAEEIENFADAKQQWLAPVYLGELDDTQGNKGRVPCLSPDKLTMFFSRFIPSLNCVCIVQATREVPYGPFTSERILSELVDSQNPMTVNSAWISADGQRLYYHEVIGLSPFETILKMAAWTGTEWEPGVKTFTELHYSGYTEARVSLTADELIIFWQSARPDGTGALDVWTASRTSTEQPFGNIRSLSEINTTNNDGGPCISPDGLILYFNSMYRAGGDEGTTGIYKAMRSSLSEPFGNVQTVKIPGYEILWEHHPYVTADETALYYQYSDTGGLFFLESVQTAGLIAYWGLNGDLDDSSLASANNGTWYGTPGYSDGYDGQAITLDGSSYVEITDYKGVTGSQARTSAAWINIGDLASACTVMSWGANIPGSGNKWLFRIEKSPSSNLYRFGVETWGGYFVWSDYGLKPSQWHHVTASLSGPTLYDIKLYKDGAEAAIAVQSANITLVTAAVESVHIGSNISEGNFFNYFKGKIDEVRIYSRALTISEIRELADAGPRLAAHWKLDGDFTDSVTGHNGNGINSPGWGEGILGSGIALDGINQYIQIPNNARFKPQLPLTLGAWIYLTASGTDGLILQTDDWNTVYSGAFLRMKSDGSDRIAVGYGDGGPNSWVSLRNKTGTTVLKPGRWYHVVGVIRGPLDMSIYINGVDDGGEHGGVGSGVLHYTEHDIMIGSQDGLGAFFKGGIDDVRISNYALSKGEILQAYQTRFADGGGIKGHKASSALEKCIIENNTSQTNGGGVFSLNGVIRNCLIFSNKSSGNGGGLAGCNGIIENNTITDNNARYIGGMVDCHGTIRNLIVWGNTSDLTWAQTGTVSMPAYSCLQDYQPDAYGNINYAPRFFDSYYRLSDYSPCIDAGDPASDYSNEPDPNGLRINMGAYGNTSYATSAAVDSDSDGMPDSWEMEMFNGLGHAPNADSDGDRVSNLDEYRAGTDPTDSTDYLIPLWWYVTYRIDPQIENVMGLDYDQDGLSNFEEFGAGTNPHNDDSDGDGVPDRWEVDYAGVINVDPAIYDAHTQSVGGIPAIWWYTWWTYCNEHPDSEIQALRDNFIPSESNALTDLDGDGLTNFQEWQNGTDPTASNADDFWVEYVYDSSGKDPNERQMVYVLDQGNLVEHCTAETTYDCDNLGRRWRTRQKANPVGLEDDLKDAISLTKFNVDGSVHKSVRKGINAANPSVIEETYDIIVAYTYDSFGRQLTVTDAMAEVTTYHYDEDCGHLEYVTLPGTGRTMAYEYDDTGRVIATTNPEGHYETRAYNSQGQVVKQVLYEDDTMAVAVMQRRMQYDNLGTLVRDALMANAASTNPDDIAVDKVTINEVHYNDPNKLINTITYSSVGEIVDSTWSWSDITADATGRGLPTEIQKGFCSDDASQPLVRQHIIYDKAGRVIERYTDHYDSRIAQTPTLSQKAAMEYDAYGRMVASIAEGDTSISTDDLRTEYVYCGSQKVAQIDPKEFRTTFAYDAFGRMETKTEDAEGLARVTEYEYDRLGNLTTLVANDGTTDQTTAYLYDKGGKVTQITYPDNGTIVYQYTNPAAGGRPTHRTDQRSITTVYTYDKLGNLLQKQNAPSNPTVVETYTYDPRGLMKTAVKVKNDQTVSSVQMGYNGLGYMTASAQSIRGGTARTISYTRNQLGQATEIGYPTATQVTLAYSYTSLGQIDTITRDAIQLVDYSYAGSMVTGRTYPSPGPNVTFTPQYDDFGRITRHTTFNGSNVGVDFAYVYDDNGNITQQDYLHRPSQPVVNAFGYDDLNRLTLADYGMGGGAEQFNYDLLGNRQTVTDSRTSDSFSYVHNEVNEYETITLNGTPATLLHDAAGNLTRDHRGYLYEYDMENRLTTVRRSDTTTIVATFDYDALGRRIEKVDAIAGTTTRYYYDDQRVAVQTLVSGGVETDDRYFVFGNYIDEVLVMNNDAADLYYAHDHLYSPVALFAAIGSVVERYEYDAYGQVQFLTSNFYPLPSSQYGNPYTFTGRERDPLDNNTLHLMYYRARSMDPDTGRFMQRDPLGVNQVYVFDPLFLYQDGMNLYEYVQSRPVTAFDPWGLLTSACACKPGKFQHSWTRWETRTHTCKPVGGGLFEQITSPSAIIEIIKGILESLISASTPSFATNDTWAVTMLIVRSETTNRYFHRDCCTNAVRMKIKKDVDYSYIKDDEMQFLVVSRGQMDKHAMDLYGKRCEALLKQNPDVYSSGKKQCILNDTFDYLFPGEKKK
jgi:RHS repeat-associated protein